MVRSGLDLAEMHREAVALALAGALVPGPPATTQQAAVFGASADLVVIDLIATDGGGRLVADLRAEEIEVYEDGKRQRVEFARFVTAGDREAAVAPAPPAYLFAKTLDLKLPEDRCADLLSRENVEIANQAAAPKKGRHQVAVVVRHSGGRLASATADLDVP